MRKILTLLLTLIISLAVILGGCSKSPMTTEEVNKEPTSFEKTDVILVQNGVSDYKIVIPNEPTGVESYAANELKNFLFESTGATLPIISDAGLVHDNAQKYLSIGNTSLLAEQTDIEVNYAVMGENGPSIDTRGNTVYMAGAADTGTLNSVYKFLYYQIGWKTYAYDCVKYDYHNTLYLLDFNYHYVPAIEWCFASDYSAMASTDLASCMRMYGMGCNNGPNDFYGRLIAPWCHSIPIIMPETEYASCYGQDSQFCYTLWLPKQAGTVKEGEESALYKTFAENLYNKYMAREKTRYVMLGGADNESFCACDGCIQEIELYGKSGVFMRFLNKFQYALEEVLQEKGVDDKIVVLGLFYHATTIPPLKTDVEGNLIVDENGKYIPLSPDCVADSEGQVTVGVCYAPIAACTIHSYADDSCPKNRIYGQYVDGYSSLTNDLMIYTYGTNFSSYSTFYNNWGYFGSTYRMFAKSNVRMLFDESGGFSSEIKQMEAFRVFYRFTMAWNPYQNFNELLDEFCDAYYGPGADGVKAYFYESISHYGYLNTISGDTCHLYSTTISDAKYWPLQTLKSLAAKLQSAMNTVQLSGLSEDEKEIYVERIYRNFALIKWQEYKFYGDKYSKEEQAELEKLVFDALDKYGFATD